LAMEPGPWPGFCGNVEFLVFTCFYSIHH
jgi:hypothetical protein